jgi:hypothetical protein
LREQDVDGRAQWISNKYEKGVDWINLVQVEWHILTNTIVCHRTPQKKGGDDGVRLCL